MTNRGRSPRFPPLANGPTAVHVVQLLCEAEHQYEECMRLADLADVPRQGTSAGPRYARDNPLGLVVALQTNAKLV